MFLDSHYAVIKEGNRLFTFFSNCVFIMFSQTFEKQFKTLIGKKKLIQSFCHLFVSSTDLTEATSAFSGKNPFFILLLIDWE